MRNEYHNAVRRFINTNTAKANFGARVFQYQIGEDEVHDPSLVSLRAYGTRSHSDIVVLACGNSFSFEPLPLNIIILPDLPVLVSLQKRYGVING